MGLVLAVLAACAPAAPTPVPTKPPTAAPTVAPAVAATPTAAAKPIAPTATPAPKIKRGGTLRTAVQNDFNTLAPYLSASPIPYIMYESLVRWRPDARGVWGPEPGLALSWEQKGTEAILKLRQKVKFHDGTDWNAKVAKWNLDRIRTHPKSQAKTYVEFIDPAKGVEVVDDYTLKVNLKAPSATLPAFLSDAEGQMFMISQAAVEKLGDDDFGRRPVGGGPFEFVDWKPAEQVTLKRFTGYWQPGADGQPLPYLDGFSYRFVADDSVRFIEVRTGNIEFTELIHGKDIPTAKADPKLVVVEGQWLGNMYRMPFNATFGPFSDNLKLRQAGLYAIDREAMAKSLGLGTGMALKYELVPGMLGYDETVPFHWCNVEKAKQLVKDAGHSTGVDATLLVQTRMLDQQQAQMIKSMWDAVGIRTTIESLESVAWRQKVREAKAEYHVATMRGANKPDPGFAMSIRFRTGGPNNDARYSNPEMDKCLDEGDRTFDLKQRHEVYKRCQRVLFEDAYYGFLMSQIWNWVYTKDLKGFEPSWGSGWQLTAAWLDR